MVQIHIPWSRVSMHEMVGAAESPRRMRQGSHHLLRYMRSGEEEARLLRRHATALANAGRRQSIQCKKCTRESSGKGCAAVDPTKYACMGTGCSSEHEQKTWNELHFVETDLLEAQRRGESARCARCKVSKIQHGMTSSSPAKNAVRRSCCINIQPLSASTNCWASAGNTRHASSANIRLAVSQDARPDRR